jgi:hypothetical protein
MPETYFLLLPNTNATINLAGLVYIGWGVAPDEWAKQGYVATIQFCNGTTLYVDAEDALVLKEALEKYNYLFSREIKRNRANATYQEQVTAPVQPNAKQSNQKVAVAANGGSSVMRHEQYK